MKRLISLLVVLLAFGATAYAETATGKVTAASSSCLATNCTELELPIDASAASILITGTFSATLQFETSNDRSTWTNVNGYPVTSSTAATNATAAGLWQLNVAGMKYLRVRASAYASGTAFVTAVSTGGAFVPSGSATVAGSVAATQSGTWTVQPGNTANTTAWKVDGSAVTQPVSGTVSATVSQGTAANLKTAAVAYAGTGDANDATHPIFVSPGSADPCFTNAKSYKPINLTANGELVALSGTTKIYICSMLIVSDTEQNINLVEGTGSVCATGTAGVLGGATAATGPNLAANSGWAIGSGTGTVAATATGGDALCLFTSSTGQISGHITYVQK